jgi:integrase
MPNIKPLDEKGIMQFLKAIKGYKYNRPLIAEIFTGIRQGELIGLTWDRVNFPKGTIYIYW